jgi:hypothetical protein
VDSNVGLAQPMTILAEKSDSISRLHPGRAQRASQPGHAISELRVGKSLVLANHCRLVGKLLFRITEEADGRERDVHARRLPGSLASVHDQNMACNVGRGIRSEKNGCAL